MVWLRNRVLLGISFIPLGQETPSGHIAGPSPLVVDSGLPSSGDEDGRRAALIEGQGFRSMSSLVQQPRPQELCVHVLFLSTRELFSLGTP